jgi:hypothetical protein
MKDALAAASVITLVLVFVLLATGCARTVFVDRPVEIRIPVSAPCLRPSDIPEPLIYPVDALEPGASDGDIVLALLAERDQRRGMERVLRGLLGGCAD